MELLDLSPEHIWDPLIKGVNTILPRIPSALVVLAVGIILVQLFSFLARVILGAFRLPKGLRGILASMIHGLLWVFLIVSVLQTLGMNNIALVFSGSIAALALALAAGAQSLTADILAGIFLSQDRDFNVGDELTTKIGEKPAVTGTIESMDMRRTRIRDGEGKLHIIPNSTIERNEWMVVSSKPRNPRRVRRVGRP